MTDDAGAVPEVPAKVTRLLRSWEFKRKQSTVYRVGLASIGLVGSGTATVLCHDQVGQICSAFASMASAAILAFRPSSEYLKFSRAWRVLNHAVLAYELGDGTRGDLLVAVAKGEAIIGAADDDIYDERAERTWR